MKTNKKVMMSLALVAVIAIAAVGAGFAYTAMTSNTQNSASSEFISIVQGGDGAYQFSDNERVYWNTSDYKEDSTYKTRFTLTDTSAPLNVPNIGALTVVQIGKPITIVTTPQDDGTTISGLKCVVASTVENGFPDPVDGLYLILKITTTGYADQYLSLTDDDTFNSWGGSTWNGASSFNIYNTSATAYAQATVTVYYGYLTSSGGIIATHAAGVAPTTGVPSSQPVNNATLTFTIDTTLQNGVASPTKVTGVALKQDASTVTELSVAVDATALVDVVFTPAAPTDKAITAVSADTSKVVVTYDESAGKLTIKGVASTGESPVNVTVTTHDGGFTGTIAVTVTTS